MTKSVRKDEESKSSELSSNLYAEFKPRNTSNNNPRRHADPNKEVFRPRGNNQRQSREREHAFPEDGNMEGLITGHGLSDALLSAHREIA